MSFNIEKCHSLHLGSNNKKYQYTIPKQTNTKYNCNHQSYDYTFHNLTQVTEEKDLGVIVDEQLNFNKHIEVKINKANRMPGIIRSTFRYMDSALFKILYKTLVRPHVEYASIIWSSHTKGYKDKLENLQRRATKLVPQLKNLSYQDRLQSLQLPTLQYRRLRSDLIYIYKMTHSMVEMDINTHCKSCNHNKLMLQQTLRTTNRGHNKKYQIHHHPGIRDRFITSRSLPCWNSLSDKTVNSTSVNTFKCNLSSETSLPDKYKYH